MKRRYTTIFKSDNFRPFEGGQDDDNRLSAQHRQESSKIDFMNKFGTSRMEEVTDQGEQERSEVVVGNMDVTRQMTIHSKTSHAMKVHGFEDENLASREQEIKRT